MWKLLLYITLLGVCYEIFNFCLPLTHTHVHTHSRTYITYTHARIHTPNDAHASTVVGGSRGYRGSRVQELLGEAVTVQALERLSCG